MFRHADEVGDRGIAECGLDRLSGIVEFAMERAEMDTVQSERAFMKATNRFHRVDDSQHRQFVCGNRKNETAVDASLCMNQFGFYKALHHLSQIAGGKLGRFGNGERGSRFRLAG